MTTPSDPSPRLLGKRTFDETDQLLFAGASGDHNPMHVDAVAARRLIAGRQVVHGVHVFFSALEFLEHDVELSSASIDCTFSNPVCVGDPVCFMQRESQAGAFLLEAVVNGLVCADITITPLDATPQSNQTSALAKGGALPTVLGPLKQPLNEDPTFHLNRAYRMELTDSDLAVHFPKSCRFLGVKVAASIASLSYFIGMVCPGLHSVFSSFSCRLRPAMTGLSYLDLLVRKFDARYRVVDVTFDGPIQGGARAFLRPPPQQQDTADELAKLVELREFEGTRSLVIGGSRGLGELTAKILAAGGGKVEITYASGIEDARRVQNEINASGRGECTIARLDLTADDFRVSGLAPGELNMVFFYATPRIFRKKAEHFDQDVFAEFCFFYIDRFFALCSYLENGVQNRRVLVYLPSTVAITDRPRGMAEYAMAKAAAEVLAEEINANFKSVSVVSTRLPRLNTDQTATIFAAAAESNVGTLLPLIRRMHAKTRLTLSQE